MGAEKQNTTTVSSQTTQAKPTKEETALNQLQLGQAQAFDPMQRQLNQLGGSLISQLLTGQANLPGFLGDISGGVNANAQMTSPGQISQNQNIGQNYATQGNTYIDPSQYAMQSPGSLGQNYGNAANTYMDPSQFSVQNPGNIGQNYGLGGYGTNTQTYMNPADYQIGEGLISDMTGKALSDLNVQLAKSGGGTYLESGASQAVGGKTAGDIRRNVGQFNAQMGAGIQEGNINRAFTQDTNNVNRSMQIADINAQRALGIDTSNLERQLGLSQYNSALGAATQEGNIQRAISMEDINQQRALGIDTSNLEREYQRQQYNSALGVSTQEGNVQRQISMADINAQRALGIDTTNLERQLAIQEGNIERGIGMQQYNLDSARSGQAFNIGNLLNLLNLAVGGQAQVQQPILATSQMLGGRLAGLRTVTQSGMTDSTQKSMNPFLKSFQQSAGTGLGNVFNPQTYVSPR